METLAYLHLSDAYEDPTAEPRELKLFEGLNWKNLPNSAGIRFLSLALSVAILSTATHAMALQRGNSGSEVTTLQRNLQIAGFYDGPITGYYGQLTRSAVIRFQRASGLTPDGIAGTRTLAALENRGGENPGPITGGGFGPNTLRRGSNGTYVSRLQQALTNAKVYSGSITGYFGQETEAAVIKFQRANGLVADGIVGQRTKAALAAD